MPDRGAATKVFTKENEIHALRIIRFDQRLHLFLKSGLALGENQNTGAVLTDFHAFQHFLDDGAYQFRHIHAAAPKF
jgi:hypothetical protein